MSVHSFLVSGQRIPRLHPSKGGFEGSVHTHHQDSSAADDDSATSEESSEDRTDDEDSENVKYHTTTRQPTTSSNMSTSSCATILLLSCFMFVFCLAIPSMPSALQSYIDQLVSELNSISMDAILYWNLVTLQACANDYDVDIALVSDQAGPTAASRALAIIHGAMYEAAAAFHGVIKSVYQPEDIPSTRVVSRGSATDAAIMEAAYRTLYVLYPKQRPVFDGARNNFLKRFKSSDYSNKSVQKGVLVGQYMATFMLNERKNDGSSNSTSYTPIDQPGYHRVDPLHPTQGFSAVNWGSVKPFLLPSGSQFHPPNNLGSTPQTRLKYLNSAHYMKDYAEVKAIGSKVSSVRTSEQEEIGISWAYDGAPKVGTPLRLYNQVVRIIAIEQKNTLLDNARLFAMLNFAMADAGIVAWNVKNLYGTWHPIVGIRNAIGMTVPSTDWEPLGAPADGKGTDFTPNFPAYPSGHAAYGSACFETLRLFYKSDSIHFKFQSDEYNGKTIDSRTGQPRPVRTRTYQSFTQAETENYLGRIYLGVHWRVDQSGGEFIGRNVAKYVFNAMTGTEPCAPMFLLSSEEVRGVMMISIYCI